MTPKRIRFLRLYISEEGYDYARWRAMNKESAEWFRDYLVFHDKFALRTSDRYSKKAGWYANKMMKRI